jgi:Skp family chaperone for outer membrane proteins
VSSLRRLLNTGILLLALPAATASGAANAAEAQAAIADAERAIAEARSQQALWTSAEEALRQARLALEGGDLSAAVRLAGFASEQAQLGVAQKQYPNTR